MDNAACRTNGRQRRLPVKLDATLLGICTGLFCARVAAQLLQYFHPLDVLPPFHVFQGSTLPYPTLLAAQLLIVCVMTGRTHAVACGHRPRQRRRGQWLAILGALYLMCALVRIVVGHLLPSAAPWFRASIPATFHLVLASFVLVLARHDLRQD